MDLLSLSLLNGGPKKFEVIRIVSVSLGLMLRIRFRLRHIAKCKISLTVTFRMLTV